MRTGGCAVLLLFLISSAYSDCISVMIWCSFSDETEPTQDPSPPECSDYKYSATSNVTTLCRQMPHMPGCTLYRLCNTTDSVSQTDYCQPFSILTEICLLDNMSRMKGCHVYNSLCQNNTSVKQCHLTPSTLLNIPNTKVIFSAIFIMTCGSKSVGVEWFDTKYVWWDEWDVWLWAALRQAIRLLNYLFQVVSWHARWVQSSQL